MIVSNSYKDSKKKDGCGKHACAARKARHPLVNALIFSTLLITMVILIGPVWEVNDDPAMAFLISRNGNDYSPFQWDILTKLLHQLYVHFPDLSWWAVCSMVSIWFGAVSVSYVVNKSFDRRNAFLISIILMILLWYVALYRINFTRTAIVVAIGGCSLIAYSSFSIKRTHAIWITYLTGCILLLLGASIRSKCGLIALGFLAVVGLINLMSDKFKLQWSWISAHLRPIIMLCMAAAVFFSVWIVNQISLTQEQKNYEDYNVLRSGIQDYASRYPSYEEAAVEFEEAGLAQHEYEMLQGWFSEDTEAYTLEVLENVNALGTKTASSKAFVEMISGQKLMTFIALTFVVLISCLDNKTWLKNIAIIAFVLLCCAYLSLSGRIPARVYLSLLYAGAVSAMLVSSSTQVTAVENVYSENECYKPKNYVKTLLGVRIYICIEKTEKYNLLYKKLFARAIVFAYILTISLGLWRVTNLIRMDVDSRLHWNQSVAAESNRKILDAIDEDQEHIYMFDIYYSPASMNSAITFWESLPADYCANRFDLGGWDARHPYHVNLLKEYGIDNPVRALFARDDVFSTYSPRLLQYLRLSYGAQMSVSEIHMIEEIPIVKYSFLLDDVHLYRDDQVDIRMKSFYYVDDKPTDAWYFSAQVVDTEEENRKFFCNITVNGLRYTYQLKCDGDNISAYFYGIDAAFDPSTANITVYELQSDGKYVAYNLVEEIN